MSFVTKDGFWIEGENEHELVVPRGLRSKLNVLDDWCGTTQEELQQLIAEASEIAAADKDNVVYFEQMIDRAIAKRFGK